VANHQHQIQFAGSAQEQADIGRYDCGIAREPSKGFNEHRGEL
jgi:hypothetical protein